MPEQDWEVIYVSWLLCLGLVWLDLTDTRKLSIERNVLN